MHCGCIIIKIEAQKLKIYKTYIFCDISAPAAMKIRILNHTNASQVNHAVILVRGCVENYSAEVWRKHSR